MYQNDATGQNTLYVNDMLVRIFKIILVVIITLVILKAARIITLPWPVFAIMSGAGAVTCLLPIAFRHFRMDGNLLKYVNIYCSAILCIFVYFYLNTGAIVLLIIPIGFACLYFDLKLILHSSALSVSGLLAGLALSRGTGWSGSAAAGEGYVRIIVHILQFGIATLLLMAIAKRVLNMLANTHSYYENINNIFSNAQASAQSLEAAEGILLNGVSSLNGNNETSGEAPAEAEEDPAITNAKVRSILSNINKSMENAKEIMKYTQAMLIGKGKSLKPGDEIAKLDEYRKNSKEYISKLAKHTEKINEDLALIAVMIDESKLLSINAAAEAENASSGGKGSAILAMKVEKLADESVESASHIQELLSNVVKDAESTMTSVAETYEEIFKSLELINRTVETLIKWLMYKNMK